jgi:hypothetical protein
MVAEVAEERAKGIAEVDARRAELHLEVATMHKHKEAQEGHVELNIGGFHFETSVQTLRRVPHTFFDAYFSGRYAQDVCNDGSTSVDRDGEHFGHVLKYMRDGVVSLAEPGARPSVSLLRALKREFGFYCIELCAEQSTEAEQLEAAFVMGGCATNTLSSMERYDLASGQWSMVAAMSTERSHFRACVVAGELYVTGGMDDGSDRLSSVEKFSPSSDTRSAVTPLPATRTDHAAVAVGSHVYVLGSYLIDGSTSSVLKLDTTQGVWSDVAPMPVVASNFAACAVGSDIYVFGGLNVNEGARAELASVFRYDTAANTWSTLAPMPHSFIHHSASVLDGLVYIVELGVGATLCVSIRCRTFGARLLLH